MAAVSQVRGLDGARVLITGASGFIGAHVTQRLVSEGARVHAVSRWPSSRSFPIGPDVRWHFIDLLDANDVNETLRVAAPDVVMHFASYGARSGERDRHRLFEVNVRGTWNLLNALPKTARLIMTGTCAEYGDFRGPAPESSCCRPRSAYAATKHAGVNLALADSRETGRSVIVLRPYGPFGPGDDPSRVLPAAITGLIKGEDVAVSDGAQVRDFSYIADHVNAIMLATMKADVTPGGAIFNIGTGRGITVRAALERIVALVDGPGRIVFAARQRRHDDISEMVANTEAARRDLGFEVTTSFDDGVIRTAMAIREQLGSNNHSPR